MWAGLYDEAEAASRRPIDAASPQIPLDVEPVIPISLFPRLIRMQGMGGYDARLYQANLVRILGRKYPIKRP
jgi:hypothetical protein